MLSGILSRAATFVTCTLNDKAPGSGTVIGSISKDKLRNQGGAISTAQVDFDSDISQPKPGLTRMNTATIARNIRA